MGSSARVAVSAALAVPVAIALFFVMHSLISRDFKQEDVKARKIADIVVPDKTIETNLNEVKPEKIDDPDDLFFGFPVVSGLDERHVEAGVPEIALLQRDDQWQMVRVQEPLQADLYGRQFALHMLHQQ